MENRVANVKIGVLVRKTTNSRKDSLIYQHQRSSDTASIGKGDLLGCEKAKYPYSSQNPAKNQEDEQADRYGKPPSNKDKERGCQINNT